MLISIVIPYYNKKQLLLYGLESVSKTSYKDIEVIIMDDASNEENRLEDIVNNYWFPIRLYRIEDSDRWWGKDPVVVSNLGIDAALGDIVISQLPECCYIGDVLLDVSVRISKNSAVMYACYGLSKSDTEAYLSGHVIHYSNVACDFSERDRSAWWCHPTILTAEITMCYAMSKSNWYKIGLIDMKFKDGQGFSDHDIVEKSILCGLYLSIPHYPHVLHLFHPHNVNNDYDIGLETNMHVYARNRYIREKYTLLKQQLGIRRSIYD